MVSKNEHTGAKQQTKVPSQQYKDNYDLIFGVGKHLKDVAEKAASDAYNKAFEDR